MFSQKWDIPHPYRVSLYDSFYSKLNEGSLMGEGQYGSPPPFFNLKKILQEMTHTQEEGTKVALQHMLQKLGRGQKTGAGSLGGRTKPRRMFSSPQYLM